VSSCYTNIRLGMKYFPETNNVVLLAYLASEISAHLESFLHSVAPHLFVVVRLVVDGINDEEGEVPVVDLLLEGLDEGDAIALLQLLLIGVLSDKEIPFNFKIITFMTVLI